MSTALALPTLPSSVTGPSHIPDLSETANIQTALKYLYYGSTGAANSANGIYGALSGLKNYIDAGIAGVNVHESAKMATTGALGTAANLVGGTITTTYTNGTADASGGTGIGATLTIATSTNWTAITIDGQSLVVGDRVVIKNQTTTLQNGIYTVTSVGAVGNTTSFVFTRAEDSNNSIAGEMGEGDFVFVANGTTNGNTSWVLTSATPTGTGPAGAIKIGTDPVSFLQYGSVSFGTQTANTIFAGPTNGAAAIPTFRNFNYQDLSTLTTPSVTGQVPYYAPAGNGIGWTSGTLSIPLSASLTLSGGFALILTQTAATNVTLPTTGTLATLAGSETLSSKTLSSPTISGATIRPNTAVTYSATPTVVDASSGTELYALTGAYAAAVTINISNLTAGRQVKMYLRNTAVSQSTVTIAAGTATTYTNVNMQPATPGGASVTSIILSATSGTAVVTIFNAGGTIGGSIG